MRFPILTVLLPASSGVAFAESTEIGFAEVRAGEPGTVGAATARAEPSLSTDKTGS